MATKNIKSTKRRGQVGGWFFVCFVFFVAREAWLGGCDMAVGRCAKIKIKIRIKRKRKRKRGGCGGCLLKG